MAKYIVIEVYYKHGEYSISQFSLEESLRSYLISSIMDFAETDPLFVIRPNPNVIRSKKDTQRDINKDVEYLNTLLTEKLVGMAKHAGLLAIERQIGYGIVGVYHGTVV
jgi:hypothetical protein